MRSTSLFFFADTVSALKTVRDFVTPAMHILTAVASLICVLFIVYAGYQYMMSRGKPDQLEHAKELVKKAILGLVLVLAATTLVAVLTQAYGSPQAAEHATLPHLETVQTKSQQNGLLETVITMITGLCSTILNTLAAPVLHALEFFTTTTPLMATNKSVFNLWLVMTGIANSLLVLVLGLLGLQIMSAQSFGLEEVDTKQILPRVGLIFLLMNSSIFLIDSVISLSNVLITAIGQVSGVTPVWRTLTGVVEKTAGQGIAALCIMIVFVICAVALLIYYVMRLVTLYIGTVLSPLVSLLWLVPGFRDFAETALKTYLTTIFVIFIHVVILQLASSLLVGLAQAPQGSGVLMAIVTGIATIVMLLKVQGVMLQLSYVGMGTRSMKQLGGQFINGINYVAGPHSMLAQRTMARVRQKTFTAKTRIRTALRPKMTQVTVPSTKAQPVHQPLHTPPSVYTTKRVQRGTPSHQHVSPQEEGRK